MPVDPSAVKTWANLVTVARVLIAPFMFVLIPDKPGGSWVAFALWFVLCSTDGIDGYLARRHGSTTVGAFLDPLADKVLVIGAMVFLVNSNVFWIVPVIIVANIPARLLIKSLGQPAWLMFHLIVAGTIAALISRAFWRWALRHYSSASS